MDNDIKKFEPFWDTWYIKDIIGEGSFGKVYSIERTDFGNTYIAAMKHIRVPQSQSEVKSIVADGMDNNSVGEYFEKLVEDIVEEFVLMSKLKGNSHIVSYEDHKVIKNPDKIEWDIFIRMEKLTGLIDYIENHKIVKKDIIKLGIDICKALELCQKYNIVHRDIKPENIFVSDNGDFKLGDFGIARQVEKTTAGLSKKGTYTYIAPEVYKGEAYGSTVDIYSLGIVMYRLLNNNRTPFMPEYPKPISHGDRESALIKRVSGQKIPKPVNADGRLAEIVLKACEYEPKNRYNSPILMRMELESILYNAAEGKIIYPKGDTADIKSIHYVSTASDLNATQTMSGTEYQSTQLMSTPNLKEDSYKNKGKNKNLYMTLGACAIGAALIGGISYTIISNNETAETDLIVETETYSEEGFDVSETQGISEEVTGDLNELVNEGDGSIEEDISKIKKLFYDVNNNIKSYTYRRNGDCAGYYFQGEYPVKIAVFAGYDSWKYRRDYYYDNEKLCFAFLYQGNEEHRFYFKDGQIIRYIDANGKIYNSDTIKEISGFDNFYNRVISESKKVYLKNSELKIQENNTTTPVQNEKVSDSSSANSSANKPASNNKQSTSNNNKTTVANKPATSSSNNKPQTTTNSKPATSGSTKTEKTQQAATQKTETVQKTNDDIENEKYKKNEDNIPEIYMDFD